MALETGTYVHELNASNPSSGDPLSQADDHMRLIKSTLKNTFPNITGAVTATHSELNSVSNLVGSVVYFPANVAPTGFLKANGTLVSRSTYSSLWTFAQASGNISASDGAWSAGQFSPGDGSTTFRLPDLRGEFIRGFDDGRGVDSGRAIGTAQTDAFKSHTHSITTIADGQAAGGAEALHVRTSTGAFSTGATGGTETRPRNVALLACIKY